MKDEPIAAGGPTPPTAEDLDDAQRLGWDVLDLAIARLHESEARAARSRELADLDPRLERWHEFELRASLDARTELLRVVLMTDPSREYRGGPCLEKYRREPVGVTFNGRVYLAIPDPNRDGAVDGPGQPDAMLLVVVDRAAIRDVEGGLPPEAYTPAGWKPPEPDPPAPAPAGWGAVEWRMLGDAAERLGFDETWRRLFGPVVERLDRDKADRERPG